MKERVTTLKNNNCERRISGTLGKTRQHLRVHQTHPDIGPFHKEMWWFGCSFDDGYLYRPEQPGEGFSFTLADKMSEIDLY